MMEIEKNTVDKLELILQKVNKIELQLNPPLWEKFLKWFIANFITIVFLVFIAYVIWKVWIMVGDVKEFTETFDENIKLFFTQQLEKIKFW